MAASNAGGFIPYSPPPSSLASSNASQALPHPRSTPLKPGGTKESSFIRHVDHQILHIQRRFAKRTAPTEGYVQETDEDGRMIQEIDDSTTKSQLEKSEEWHDVRGYNTFAEATRDIEELVGVIWISGTRRHLHLRSPCRSPHQLSESSISSSPVCHLTGSSYQHHDYCFSCGSQTHVQTAGQT